MEQKDILALKSELEKKTKELLELQEKKRKIGVEVKKIQTHKEEIAELTNKKSVIKFYEFDRKTRLNKEIQEHNAVLNAVTERIGKAYGIKTMAESELILENLSKKIKDIQGGSQKLSIEIEKVEKKHKKHK